jgi:hypothetical protein
MLGRELRLDTFRRFPSLLKATALGGSDMPLATTHSTSSLARRGRSSGGAGKAYAPPTTSMKMEPLLSPLLIFLDMKEIKKGL